MRNKKIILKCSKHLSTLDKKFYFHDIEHTRFVVRKTAQLLKNSTISQKDYELGIITAWSHDLGYKQGSLNHEERSVELVSSWMKEYSYSASDILEVSKAIMASKIPQNPVSEIGKAICDADMAHLASPQYDHWADKLEAEWVATKTFPNDKSQLLDIQINFIQKHQYITDYAIATWESRKQKNLARLIEKRNQI